MWHVWISSLGVTSAIILAGGYVVLQMQRDRHRFRLMQTALEQGITDFSASAGPPYWLVSLRQGVAFVVLGLGLMVVGGVAYSLVESVTPPTPAQLAQVAAPTEIRPAPPPPPREEGKPHPPPPHRPKPPPPNPALEAWHQARRQQAVGLITVGGGFLITLLGAVRTAFAQAERKYADRSESLPP